MLLNAHFFFPFQVKAEDVTGRVESIMEELRMSKGEVSSLRAEIATLKASNLTSNAFLVGNSDIRWAQSPSLFYTPLYFSHLLLH